MSMEELGLDSGERDVIVLHDGTVLETHGPTRCVGGFCSIHCPSVHPLNRAPLVWSRGTNLMLRVCDHGKLHPDPDSVRALSRGTVRHDCCEERCCEVPVAP